MIYSLLVALGILGLGIPNSHARFASIVVDAESGRILHAVNAETKNYPASLTKIMTLFMTFEALRDGRLQLDQELPVSRVAEGRSPSKLGLQYGDMIEVRHAIAALVTKSANDVATVLAEAIGGTERKFARMMTQRAHALGMTDTTFMNASGLPNRRQLSTARDMAILARAMLRIFPQRYANFSRQKFEWNGRTYHNHNTLMERYDGMDGIKTGYIRASGFNLVASAERNGVRLIGVVFGGKSPRWRDNHMAKLLDEGFAESVRIAQVSGAPKKALPLSPAHQQWQNAGKPHGVAMASADTGQDAAPSAPDPSPVWAIQVGAYNRYAPAHLAVTRAARAVPSLLGEKFQILRQNSRRRGLQIYKARVLLDNESDARRSCLALKQRNIACVVIAMKPAY